MKAALMFKVVESDGIHDQHCNPVSIHGPDSLVAMPS